MAENYCQVKSIGGVARNGALANDLEAAAVLALTAHRSSLSEALNKFLQEETAMVEDVAIVTIHEAAASCQGIDVMRLAWEKKLPSIRIGATRYVPTDFLRKLRGNPERALREYAKATAYWTLEPDWSAAELAAIAEIREEALAHALRRKPNRRPKWLAAELAAAEVSKPAPEPERPDQRLTWMSSAGTGKPHPLPAVVVEKMPELNEGELKTFLALYHLSMGTLQDLERIDVAELARITGLHRVNVYKARKRLEARGIIPCSAGATDNLACSGSATAAIPGSGSATNLSSAGATDDLISRPTTNGSRPPATSE